MSAADATAPVPGGAPLGNRGFFRALVQALVALVLSGFINLGGYLTFSPILAQLEAAATRVDVRPWSLDGADLLTRTGGGEAQPDRTMRVTELANGEDPRALFTRRAQFQAEDYPFLESAIGNRPHPGIHFYFIWRTARAPAEVFYQPIRWTGGDTLTQLLAKHPEWRGSITEIGLDIYGDLRGQNPEISSLTLRPAAPGELLKAIFGEWLAYRQWTQKSAHHLTGTPAEPIQAPTVPVASWAAVAALLLFFWGRLRPGHVAASCLIAIAIPWFFLDLLWQKNLNAQLAETRHRFADKTMAEKHRADNDGELYAYIQRLKQGVLPAPGAKIHLIHREPHRTYARLKAQYYLFPHNTYNYDRQPKRNKVQPGQYLIILGELPGLRYDEGSGRLHWRGGSLRAELLDRDPMGQVYRVSGGDK